MAKLDTWKCDVCGNLRESKSDGWWMGVLACGDGDRGGFTGLDGVFVTPFGEDKSDHYGLEFWHFCGITCAVKWVDGELKKQTGGLVNR